MEEIKDAYVKEGLLCQRVQLYLIPVLLLSSLFQQFLWMDFQKDQCSKLFKNTSVQFSKYT